MLDAGVVQKARNKDYHITNLDRFAHRIRHFTDSAIIGSKAFVQNTYQKVKGHFQTKKDNILNPVAILQGVYSLRRLAAAELVSNRLDLITGFS